MGGQADKKQTGSELNNQFHPPFLTIKASFRTIIRSSSDGALLLRVINKSQQSEHKAICRFRIFAYKFQQGTDFFTRTALL